MLEKIRVLEFASVLAGPSVGQFLAELGAEVIKIENPKTQGDVTRSWLFDGEEPLEGISAYFSSVNWGKKSMLLDLQLAENALKIERLVASADIVITSFKPGDDKKLGIDYRSLRAIKKDIIYGHITGYGTDDLRVGYDAVIQAESGFMSINGEKGGMPLKMPVALMDILAGHHLKEGLLLALIRRMNSGEGSYVPVSLIDAAVSSLANQGANFLVGGIIPQRTGNEHPNISPYGDVFETADKKQIILAIGNDKQFLRLCEILENGLEDQNAFSTNAMRVENRDVLKKELDKSFRELDSAIILSRLNQEKVPAGLVKSINETLCADGTTWFHQNGTMKGLRNFMGLPLGIETRRLSPPPNLGEHTDEILNSLS